MSEKDINGKSYHVKFKEEEEKLKEKKYHDIKYTNLVRLATFTKGLVSKAMSTVRVEVEDENVLGICNQRIPLHNSQFKRWSEVVFNK